jgi:hypothetical protein
VNLQRLADVSTLVRTHHLLNIWPHQVRGDADDPAAAD